MKISLLCTNSGSDISLAELKTYTEGWLLSCEIDQHSPNTITFRSNLLKKLVWFLERENCASCGLNELRKFFHYIQNGYKNPEGRCGGRGGGMPVEIAWLCGV